MTAIDRLCELEQEIDEIDELAGVLRATVDASSRLAIMRRIERMEEERNDIRVDLEASGRPCQDEETPISLGSPMKIETRRMTSGWHWYVTKDGEQLAGSNFTLINEQLAIEAAEEWIKGATAANRSVSNVTN